MVLILQLDIKNSNQRLIKTKNQSNYFLTFVVHFAIECELTPQK